MRWRESVQRAIGLIRRPLKTQVLCHEMTASLGQHRRSPVSPAEIEVVSTASALRVRRTFEGSRSRRHRSAGSGIVLRVADSPVLRWATFWRPSRSSPAESAIRAFRPFPLRSASRRTRPRLWPVVREHCREPAPRDPADAELALPVVRRVVFCVGAVGGHMAKDPVCGMQVDEGNAAGQTEHQAKRYYFCSASCQKRFQQNPAAYAGKA
jgi:YHS domain-containing protein